MAEPRPVEDMSGDDLEQWVRAISTDDWRSALDRLARDCLISEAILNQMLRMVGVNTPILGIFREQYELEDPTDDLIGPVRRSEFEPLIRQALSLLNSEGFRLHYGLRWIIQRFGLKAADLAEFIDRTELFAMGRSGLLQGISEWYEEDHASAFTSLMPQLDLGIRRVLHRIDEPIPARHTLNLMDVLRRESVAQKIGRDLRLHLLAIYCDPSGWNLQNRFARGFIHPSAMNAGRTNWLVHSLLVLGGV